MKVMTVCALVCVMMVGANLQLTAGEDDPFLWLEEVEGKAALEWVTEQSKQCTAELEAVPEYSSILQQSLEIYNSEQRIPSVAIRGQHLYNFWQDKQHVRGIWRRTSLEQYRSAEPVWETVLDIDALAQQEGESWVFKGASCLPGDYRLCMVSLSRGGGDAVVQREFDTQRKEFVTDGFSLPEAKSETSFLDENTLWVATDFGEGTLTTSGYPRIAKLWQRGTPLADARTVFEGDPEDVFIGGFSSFMPEGRYDLVIRAPSFFEQDTFLMLGERLVRLEVPRDAKVWGFFKDRLLVSLRTPWAIASHTYSQGALLAIELDAFLQGSRDFDVLFEPSERVSLSSLSSTRDRLLLSTLDNVRGRLESLRLTQQGWSRQQIPLPGMGQTNLEATSDDVDYFFFRYEDSLTPDSLWFVDADEQPVKTKSLPAFFDTDGMKVVQYEATSADGTKIPYFVTLPKGFVADGTAPTLLYGYGGFEISMVPRYRAIWGIGWIERGGVAVVANIRGGGEFGPAWHQAAVKENRHKAFEDFIAVAEDLIARKITSQEHLGIEGGSNGGLLVGAVFTQRPDLFSAVVCAVPLLDMQRYHLLHAGASWMAEYGNPDDPEEWAFIKTWSPYHNLHKDVSYPRVLFITSTRDDRVHPGHARKMAAKMLAMGKPVLYYENTEGGHAAATNNDQRAKMRTLELAYLWKQLR